MRCQVSPASRLAALMAAVLVAAALAACGSSSPGATGSSSSSLTTATTTSSVRGAVGVSPAQGGPGTRFALHFVAPGGAGRHGDQRVGFTVGLTGPTSTSCVGARTLTAPSGPQGTTVTMTLDPGALGGRWCPGTHNARVIELETPICNPGTMCPDYERVIGTVGETSFTVTGAA